VREGDLPEKKRMKKAEGIFRRKRGVGGGEPAGKGDSNGEKKDLYVVEHATQGLKHGGEEPRT